VWSFGSRQLGIEGKSRLPLFAQPNSRPNNEQTTRVLVIACSDESRAAGPCTQFQPFEHVGILHDIMDICSLDVDRPPACGVLMAMAGYANLGRGSAYSLSRVHIDPRSSQHLH
jgi:hypothetical protein